jgi:hypothetical protein
VCTVEEDDCDPLYAECRHLGPGHHDCTCHIGWTGNGHTCKDINECTSNPCLNGGKCIDSGCRPSSKKSPQKCDPQSQGRPPIDAFSCACAAGYANGICSPGWDKKSPAYTKAYAPRCAVKVGARCDVDID